MRPLAIIEHDIVLADTMRAALEAAGLRADCFNESAAALEQLRRRGFSLAIIDLDLHDTDPFAVCREASRVVPVIAVTADRAPETCIRAFEANADDCLCRPFPGRELVARVRNVLRRARADDADDDDAAAAVSISIAEMRVRAGNEIRELTSGETAVLVLLMEHAPAPLTVQQISALLPGKRSTIESRIKSLRKKLGPGKLASRGRYGYQLLD